MPQRTFSFKCCFMHVNPRAYVCLENITWSELGKQSMQAKKVYSASYAGKTLVGHLKNIFYTKLAFFHFKYVYIFKKKFFSFFFKCFLAGGAFPFTIGRIEHGFNVRPDLCAVENPINPRSVHL